MVEQQFWHPVSLVSSLGEQPLAAKLLEQDLVLWKDSQGQVHALADQCPHRGAKLSLGRVLRNPASSGEPCADRLECPYHGWQFDGQAQCRLIPATPQFAPGVAMKATRYETAQAYGLVWVRMAGDAPASMIPAFQAQQDARLRKAHCGPYWVNTSAPRVVENFLDMAHFGYVHEHYLGDRQHVALEPYQVQETSHGLLATQCKAWQPKSSLHATTASMVEYSYEVNAPYTAVLNKMPEPGTAAIANFFESIGLFICPVEAERSLVWFVLAMNDFHSPDASLQAFQDTIFSQDKPVLESQRPKCLPLDPRVELHSGADKAAMAYRRYLKRLGIQFGVIQHDV